MAFKKTVAHVDAEKKRLRFSDGSSEDYDILVSTMPLDTLICRSSLEALKPAASRLRSSSTHVVGIGLKGSPGPHLRKKCWMYFPESNAPFYRVTVFSNYSPNNVPDASRYWSLMLEVSESPEKPVDGDKVLDECIAGLLATGLIEDVRDIASAWRYFARHGYPTPSLERDAALAELLPAIEEHGIFSRGRFGAWKYEVSNQDHSFMQGVELANRLASGSDEVTLNSPATVNAMRPMAKKAKA
jgi:protoporphyrinogen oxidase